jgi:hypothetical protein
VIQRVRTVIRIPFTPGMTALIAARLSRRAAHDALINGRRYGGEDAAAAGTSLLAPLRVGDSRRLDFAMVDGL